MSKILLLLPLQLGTSVASLIQLCWMIFAHINILLFIFSFISLSLPKCIGTLTLGTRVYCREIVRKSSPSWDKTDNWGMTCEHLRWVLPACILIGSVIRLCYLWPTNIIGLHNTSGLKFKAVFMQVLEVHADMCINITGSCILDLMVHLYSSCNLFEGVGGHVAHVWEKRNSYTYFDRKNLNVLYFRWEDINMVCRKYIVRMWTTFL
jgi:hypothetical protein